MKQLNRRHFVARLSMAAAGVAAFGRIGYSSPLTNLANTGDFVDVEITHGKIRGVRTDGVNIFKGIPYAGSVSGDRRFRRPAKLEPWAGVREALLLGAPAIQSPRRNEPNPAEDCLFLNVWTPANDNKKRPVMFYNHGGGFVVGLGACVRIGTSYRFEAYHRAEPFVFVSFRVGDGVVLAFLLSCLAIGAGVQSGFRR